MQNIKLTNGIVVTDKGLKRLDITLSNGRIDLLGRPDHIDKIIDLDGKYVIPGLVDIHFHGYNFFDFTFGLYRPETGQFDASELIYRDSLEMLSRALTKFGVTGFYISSSAASIATLKKCYSYLSTYLEEQSHEGIGSRLFGGMLEGTFIHPDMAGAQNAEYIHKPSRELFDRIEDRGSIKLANVVPDYGVSAYELTDYLSQRGIVVGAGHTNATGDQFAEAIKSGLKYCIHFTNGPTGGSYKPFDGGGAIEAVLQNDEIYAELIIDGYHINPAYTRDIIARKGIDKIIGITDCMYVAGTQLKQINLSGISGSVSSNGKYLVLEDKNNALFGSNLTMDRAFENLLNLLSRDMAGIWYGIHPAWDFEKTLMQQLKYILEIPAI